MTSPGRTAAQDYSDDLRLAHVLADAVDSLTLDRFRAQDLRIDTKSDRTPVSDADLSAEQLLRDQLLRTRPRDAVIGEEFGSQGEGRRQWIVDPIDGTKNYVRGVPVWASLIALVDDRQPVVGLVSAPALGRRWWAALGTGAWTGSSLSRAVRISVSEVSSLAEASMSYSSLGGWADLGKRDDMLDLMSAVSRTRAFGDFWSYMLVAEGAVDIAAEPELSLHDMAALVPIVTEAGGTFTSLGGKPGPYGGNAVASNGILHAEALGYLGVQGTLGTPGTWETSHE